MHISGRVGRGENLAWCLTDCQVLVSDLHYQFKSEATRTVMDDAYSGFALEIIGDGVEV